MASTNSEPEQYFTGLALEIHNYFITYQNLIQDWQSQKVDGLRIVTTICNRKLIGIEKQQQDKSYGFTNTVNLIEKKVRKEIDDLDLNLSKILAQMNVTIDALVNLCDTMKNIHQLDKLQQKSNPNCPPLFNTGSTLLYYESFVEIVDQYSKELDMKRRIFASLSSEHRPSFLKQYKLSWQNDVFITDQSTFLLEMLRACDNERMKNSIMWEASPSGKARNS